MAQRYIGKYVGDTPAKRKFQRKTKDSSGNQTIQVGDSGTDGFILQTTSSSTGNDLNIKGGDTKSGGTNGAGGDLILYAGRGTGSGEGGEIQFQTFPASGSGTSYNGAARGPAIGSAGAGGTHYLHGGRDQDFAIRSDGNLNFHIDHDNDETSQKFSFNNNTSTEIANIDESGNLQVDGTITTGSVAAMTNAGLLSVANQSNITGLGTITSGVWNGTTIATANTAAKVTSVIAGDGIDVDSTTGDVTVTAETASATNPGVVELATTAEADTGTDTARAVTPAGLKSHVDAKHYDILHINGFMSAASTNQYQGYGGHYNFNIGVSPYTDSGTIGNANSTKWGHYVAMSNCTIDRIMYRASDTGGGSGDNYSFELWKYTAVNDSASNTTTTKLGSIDITGNASAHYVHHVVDTTGYELDEGETFLPVIRKTSSGWAGNILFECALRFRYDAS